MISPYFILISWLALPRVVMAGSIDWGTSVSDQLYDADGAALTGSYRFELGTFRDGFVPDPTNTSQWESKWKLIEEATFNVPMQYVAENSILTSSGPDLIWERDATGDEGGPLTNLNLFAPGESVYVWAFNGKTVSSTTQWALVTGEGATTDTNWELSAALGDPLAQTRQWRLSNGNTPIFGGLNGARGAGGFNAFPGSFTLQTALLSPVPEPDITMLLAAAGVFSLHRRRTNPRHP